MSLGSMSSDYLTQKDWSFARRSIYEWRRRDQGFRKDVKMKNVGINDYEGFQARILQRWKIITWGLTRVMPTWVASHNLWAQPWKYSLCMGLWISTLTSYRIVKRMQSCSVKLWFQRLHASYYLGTIILIMMYAITWASTSSVLSLQLS